LPKLIAVVGGKHSGKTTIIEHLIVELKSRGYRVGAVKEMVRIPTLDTPATETDRYTAAGAETIVALPRAETVVFIKRRLPLNEILPFLAGLDFVLLEGFESEKRLPKIVAAKTAKEAKSYFDCSAVAVSGIIADSEQETEKAADLKVPILKALTEVEELADLAQKKAIELPV
jgi:molybdopterin-guanine dinucleotide biosynthesis adapter protein